MQKYLKLASPNQKTIERAFTRNKYNLKRSDWSFFGPIHYHNEKEKGESNKGIGVVERHSHWRSGWYSYTSTEAKDDKYSNQRGMVQTKIG